jgi:hypothetical protein
MMTLLRPLGWYGSIGLIWHVIWKMTYNNIGLLHEYCPEQYIILPERASSIWYTARDNIHAITLLLYSNKYFLFRSIINTVTIWFFHISLLYCTRKNILVFVLVQYEWHSERTGIFSGYYKDVRDQQWNTRYFNICTSAIWMTFGPHIFIKYKNILHDFL